MRLENNEYIVSTIGVPDQSITILKQALEKWRDHYLEVGKEFPIEGEGSADAKTIFYAGIYAGKHEVIVDLRLLNQKQEVI